MSFPASATDATATRLSDLIAAGSLEISPRELHRAAEVGALLPTDTCVYIPSLPGLPLPRAGRPPPRSRAARLGAKDH
jgi:hypothetical protein